MQNIAAWAVAGVIAYYLWVKPEREAEQERRVSSLSADQFPCLHACASCMLLQYLRFISFVHSLQSSRERARAIAIEKGLIDVDKRLPVAGELL